MVFSFFSCFLYLLLSQLQIVFPLVLLDLRLFQWICSLWSTLEYFLSCNPQAVSNGKRSKRSKLRYKYFWPKRKYLYQDRTTGFQKEQQESLEKKSQCWLTRTELFLYPNFCIRMERPMKTQAISSKCLSFEPGLSWSRVLHVSPLAYALALGTFGHILVTAGQKYSRPDETKG